MNVMIPKRPRSLSRGWSTVVPSPVGPLSVRVDGAGALTAIHFGGADAEVAEPTAVWARQESTADDAPPAARQGLAEAVRQLDEYFRGERRAFELRLAPEGTAFQLAVWNELGRIPYGRTVSYGDLARSLDRPGASRAVGAANGANPIPIVVPCHRVIASDGGLGGYSAGLDVKQRLLALEGALLV